MTINKQKYFCLYACFMKTKGKCRSLLTDVHNELTFFIPNDLYDILETYNGKKIADVYRVFGKSNSSVLDEYFHFLLSKDIIFLCDTEEEAGFFPPMETDWDYPAAITNAIIDIQPGTKHPWKKILDELDALNCPNVQVRAFAGYTIEKAATDILKYLGGKESVIVNVELYLPYQAGYTIGRYKEFAAGDKRISLLVVHGAPVEKKIDIKMGNIVNLYLAKEKISSDNCCGIVSRFYFAPNLSHFTESLHHNTCLNRKISIDAGGFIKNCPSMSGHYGHINDTSLKDALKSEGFKEVWNITKDKVAVCNGCEYRNVCTDCRAFVQQPGDLYSKPLKCGYNPDDCTWQHWSQNPLSRQAAVHYGINN